MYILVHSWEVERESIKERISPSIKVLNYYNIKQDDENKKLMTNTWPIAQFKFPSSYVDISLLNENPKVENQSIPTLMIFFSFFSFSHCSLLRVEVKRQMRDFIES